MATNKLLIRNIKATQGLEQAIKTLPSIVTELPVNDNRSSSSYKPEDIVDDSFQTDFDTTIDFDAIKIEEIDKAEKASEIKQLEVNSTFINDILKGDISVYENVINSLMTSDTPILELEKISGDSIQHLINNDDLKSALYFSKLFFSCAVKNYSENQKKIPSSVPLIKFKPSGEVSSNHINFAYDLLTILGYIKVTRGRLEDFEADAVKNKSLLFLATRCYGDIFIFSFLDKKNPDVIMSSVISRFNKFREIGFFNKFDELLDANGCKPIDASDISYFVEELITKVISQDTPVINDYHNTLFENDQLRIPAKNNLQIEQITKEVIKLEIGERFEKEVDVTEISDEVIKLFSEKPKKSKPKKKTTGKKPNIVRFFEKFIGEVPEDHKPWLAKIAKRLMTEEFDPRWFSNIDDASEFGETILVGLHRWDPNSPLSTGSYSEWENSLKNNVIDKKSVLMLWRTQLGKETEADDSESNWSGALQL